MCEHKVAVTAVVVIRRRCVISSGGGVAEARKKKNYLRRAGRRRLNWGLNRGNGCVRTSAGEAEGGGGIKGNFCDARRG